MDRKQLWFFGLVGWPIATGLHRLIGHIHFLDDEPLILALHWIVAIGFMAWLTIGLFRWKGYNRAQRYEAVVILCGPAMVLDALVTEFYATLFPNMDAISAGSYGAWVMVTYAACLLCAFVAPPEEPAQAPREEKIA